MEQVVWPLIREISREKKVFMDGSERTRKITESFGLGGRLARMTGMMIQMMIPKREIGEGGGFLTLLLLFRFIVFACINIRDLESMV